MLGLATAALFVAAIWLPLRRPLPTHLALPTASAIGPGVGVEVDASDGSVVTGCTAGFLVTTRTRQPAFLTAGHCNKSGGASPVVINSASSHGYVTVGHFSRTVNEGTVGEQHDIGLVVLDGDAVPQAPAVTGAWPVSGVSATVTSGQLLCKFGMTTNAPACGPVIYLTESKVGFRADAQCGDSGGPVYLVQTDGTVTAVGILIRGGDPNDPATGCAKPGKISAAELIKPWLDKWELTPVVAPIGSAH
ncbi:endopeptidase [Mycobacterium rhizamassiliense]|uniref:endopeptidase n=1 Tax=Mycobacterium rhizamassiliense TaxID=1841860 RepID=UPI003CCBF70E